MAETKVEIDGSDSAGNGGGPVPPGFDSEGGAPTRIGVLEAMRWHWALVLVPIILLVGTAIAVGLIRQPVYTATTTLSVGFGAENPSSLPGSVSAAQALSESYSRAIAATPVTSQVARRAGISPEEVTDHVSATPIAGTTVVKVRGSADSAGVAIATANTAAAALSSYVESLNGTTAGSPKVLTLFRRAEATYQDRLKSQSEIAETAAAEPSESNEIALRQAQVATQVALLRKQSLASVYGSSQQAYVAPLTVLTSATAADSDRTAKLELLIFVGLVAGLALGAALATVRANWT